MPVVKQLWDKFLPLIEAAGVSIVAAAGNEGELKKATDPTIYLDQTSPGSIGTETNSVITVGGVNNAGAYWPGTTPCRARHAGSITVYAQAVDVYIAISHPTDVDIYLVRSGTSYSAPAVVRIMVSPCGKC